MPEKARSGPYTFEISNRDKLFFPDDGLTKGDLIDYYSRVADTMLPHLQDRPVTLHRFPDGIQEDGFFQKEIPDHFPDWIRRATVPKEGGEVTHVLCQNPSTLVYLANQACITPHLWLARIDRPRHPDRLLFDLDPSGEDFEPVRHAARAVVRVLEELELPVFLKTTGSRGLHLVVPLERTADFDSVRSFARGVADLLVGREPGRFTTAAPKARRGDRVYIDVTRNAYAQTAVAPYAVRAKPGAPVATPIDREELDDPDLHPRRYTIRNIFRRLGQKDDPWKEIDRHARSLEPARERLDRGLDGR